ncbi:MAG: SIMPL domain-containing protein [bacterium]|nr:SIMPL domain-containing protein [bacterium]
MPIVSSSNKSMGMPVRPVEKSVGGGSCSSPGCDSHGYGLGKKIIITLVGVLLVYLICFIGVLIKNNIKRFAFIGKADTYEHSIQVNGYGKVNGMNDIAVTTIGYSNIDKDVAKAQADNKKVMDKIMADLKQLGVADKDTQTNYSVYPDYSYTQAGGQQLNGYRVTNQVTIKIRDLSKVTNVLALAGKYGATEVNGLNFTIDDPENLKAEARDKAVADARMKAVKLSLSLGVNLGTVISYTEYEGGNNYPMAQYKSLGMGAEGGGGSPLALDVVAGGSNDVVMNTSITYQILP